MGLEQPLSQYLALEFEEDIGGTNIFHVLPVLAKGFGDRTFRLCSLEIISTDTKVVHTAMIGMCSFRESDWKELQRTLSRASVEDRTTIVLERKASLKEKREVHIDFEACSSVLTASPSAACRKVFVRLGHKAAAHSFVQPASDSSRKA